MAQLDPSLLKHLKCKYCDDYLRTGPILLIEEPDHTYINGHSSGDNRKCNLVCSDCVNSVSDVLKPLLVRQRGLEKICALVQFPSLDSAGEVCNSGYQNLLTTHNYDINTDEGRCDSRQSKVSAATTNAPSIGGRRRRFELIRFSSVEDSFDEGADDLSLSPTSPIQRHPPHGDDDGRSLAVDVDCVFRRNKTTRRQTLLRFVLHIRRGTQQELFVVSGSAAKRELQAASVRVACQVSLQSKTPVATVNCIEVLPVGSARLLLRDDDSLTAYLRRPFNSTLTMADRTSGAGSNTSHIDQPKYCRFFDFGCRAKPAPLELRPHEQQCEYRDFRCPIPDCTWQGVLQTLRIVHLPEAHARFLCKGATSTRAHAFEDDLWVQLAHERIFVCHQYYIDGETQVVVEYVGSPYHGRQYMYSVRRGEMCKWSQCSAANTVLLDEGVKFQCDDDGSYDLTVRLVNETRCRT